MTTISYNSGERDTAAYSLRRQLARSTHLVDIMGMDFRVPALVLILKAAG